MSQPVALIAKVRLGEPAFKRFLLGKHAKLLARCIDEVLDQQGSAYYVFRYLKAEQAVFAFFYFNHGNAANLAGSVELSVLKALAPLAEPGAAGHVLCCLDALNLDPQGLGACTAIVDQRCVEGQALPDDEWPQWQKDCAKYFYKEVEKDFALNFSKGRIVDKSIVRRCAKLAEERRLQRVVAHLHQASFTRPLRFFGDYFYNGAFIYHQSGKTTPLPELDPRTFQPMPYGGADAHHAVVDGKMRRVDVATFRKLQKGEVRYFKDRQQVFDGNLDPMPQADAASFELTWEHAAQDAHHLYFAGLCLPKAELGVFRFEPHGYFHAEKLLMAENAVYMGDRRVPVDPGSFEVIEAVPDETTGVAFSFMYVVKDRQGCHVLYRELDAQGRHADATLVRTDDAGRTLAELKQQRARAYQARFADFPPDMQGEDTIAHAERFRAWAQVHFESAYQNYRYFTSGLLYVPVNNYFHGAFHQQRYAEVLAFYERIRSTAWLNPHLFHHTACCYTALGLHEEAIDEVRKACVFGYAHLDRLWADEDLGPLWHHARFQACRAAFSGPGRKLAQPELLDAIERLPLSLDRALVTDVSRFLVGLACQFWFEDPGVSPVDAVRAAQLRHVFQRWLRLSPLGYKDDEFYALYQDHTLLHPMVHAQRFRTLFGAAHRFGGTIDPDAMADSVACADRLRRAVASVTDPVLREEVEGGIAGEAFLRLVLQSSPGAPALGVSKAPPVG